MLYTVIVAYKGGLTRVLAAESLMRWRPFEQCGVGVCPLDRRNGYFEDFGKPAAWPKIESLLSARILLRDGLCKKQARFMRDAHQTAICLREVFEGKKLPA